MNHHRHLWVPLCLAVLMAFTLYIGLSQHPSSFDDAYITYRYARNIAEGRGFVYNSGESVLGTTTPLYTLLLAGLSLIWQNIPVLSHRIGVGAWVLCVPIIYGVARAGGRDLTAFAAASLIAVNWLFLGVLGMETALYVLVTLLAFYFYLNEEYTLSGVCAGLAFVMRWDGILVAGVLVFAGLVEHREDFPEGLLVSACLIIPWLAYSQMTFGSVFPNTLFAKAGQGWKEGLGGAEIGPFTRGLVSIGRSAYRGNRLVLVPVGLSVVGVFSAFRDKTRWWLVLLWTGAYFAGYAVLGVLQFSWYYPPLMPASVLLAGKGIEELVGYMPRNPRWGRLGLAVLLMGLCLIPSVDLLLASRRSEMNERVATYVKVGQWLRQHAAPDSSVATIEIGVIGFYSDLTIVDPMGLVSPDMVGHLDSWLQTLQYALNHYWPDYAVSLKGTAWGGVVGQPWFTEAYALTAEVENLANPDAPVRIYRRRAGFPLDEFAITSSKEVQFDRKLVLRRFEVAEQAISSGERLHARLIWEALDDVKAIYRLQFDLLRTTDGERATLSTDAHPMRGGNPTHLWSEGDRVVDAHTLGVPDDLEPGSYLLQLLVSREGESPSMTDGMGNAVAYVVAGPIKIDSGAPGPELLPAHSVNASFADHVSLVGYDLSQPEVDALELTLYWQARAEVPRDYTVFVHLLSPDGELIAQNDSPPALPTKLWIPGIRVMDWHRLTLPQDSPVTEYQIRAGMYHWPDLERLAVLEPDGLDAAENALLLTEIILGD